MRDKLYRIAMKARAWAKKTAKEENFPADLCGFCARGAAETFRRLRRAGISAQLAMTNGGPGLFGTWHCFVISHQYIVDVTATQFGDSPVVVRKLVKDKVREWHNAAWKFRSVKALRTMQRKQEWPRDQTA